MLSGPNPQLNADARRHPVTQTATSIRARACPRRSRVVSIPRSPVTRRVGPLNSGHFVSSRRRIRRDRTRGLCTATPANARPQPARPHRGSAQSRALRARKTQRRHGAIAGRKTSASHAGRPRFDLKHGAPVTPGPTAQATPCSASSGTPPASPAGNTSKNRSAGRASPTRAHPRRAGRAHARLRARQNGISSSMSEPPPKPPPAPPRPPDGAPPAARPPP